MTRVYLDNNVQLMTPQQIRVAGLAALTRELGVVGMIRFMQQFETGQGDYSSDRHQWLDQYTVDDIAKMVREKKGPYKVSKRKK
jgi:hypothetical protein